jgi:hypothetical protein
MNTGNLILYVLSTIGMAHIIVDASITASFREFVKSMSTKIGVPSFGGVVDCYLCCGTWCGFLMGAIWLSHNPFQILACGCAGGFLANLGAVFLNWLEAATIVNLPNDDN